MKEPNNYIFCRVTGFTSDFLGFIDVVPIRFFHGGSHSIVFIDSCKLLTDVKLCRALSDVLAFARAMQEALAKKSDSADGDEDTKPSDDPAD